MRTCTSSRRSARAAPLSVLTAFLPLCAAWGMQAAPPIPQAPGAAPPPPAAPAAPPAPAVPPAPSSCEPASAPARGTSAAAPAADGAAAPAGPGSLAGMVWIPGGEFTMGSRDPLARPDEQPLHRVRVHGFWMDTAEVTNRQFAAFVEATGYVTVAERPVDWEELRKQLPPGTPKPPDEMLQPGGVVFKPPSAPVDLRDYSKWWAWTTGASWKHPLGPGSGIEKLMDHPVVLVSWDDAVAYCRWAGKRLPTEAEWEFAARGGLEGKQNTWGDEPVGPSRCNTFQGHFPDRNTAEDGFERTAPVRSFPPNGYGLYDMAGNVWEWCSDLYRVDEYARRVRAAGPGGVIVDPKGPDQALDPRNPDAPVSRVHRGGSFLCNDSYCSSYRAAARMGCTPDTGLSHVGFRCVADAPPPASAP